MTWRHMVWHFRNLDGEKSRLQLGRHPFHINDDGEVNMAPERADPPLSHERVRIVLGSRIVFTISGPAIDLAVDDKAV